MKHVDKIEFWKERIEQAKKGREHYSVYITSKGDWDTLNNEHEKILEMEISKSDKVLDAGCGYGRWASFFSPEQYVGVDFSPDFIALARQKNPDHVFVQSTLESLPFEDGEFDVAFCVSIKEMITSNLGAEVWSRMEDELRRVAKKVLVLEYTSPEEYEVL